MFNLLAKLNRYINNIEVAAEDIAGANRYSPYFCPIAKALRRQLKSENVAVTTKEVIIEGVFYPIPPRVALRLNQYDRTGKMEPFRFRMPYPF